MILDGKALSKSIEERLASKVASEGISATLAVVLVGDDPVSIRYIERKRATAERLGITIELFEYEANIAEAELGREIERLAGREDINGILVQLPLPSHISRDLIVSLIPPTKDPDSLGENSLVLSPVVRAVEAMLDFGKVDLDNKKIVVVGQGKLVGRPVALWLAAGGRDIVVVDSQVANVGTITSQADVLILGAGQPGFIKPDMVKDGVVIIDAATSESSGRLAGDADPACAVRASLFTPVPGGVGPLTLVMLFANLLDLVKYK